MAEFMKRYLNKTDGATGVIVPLEQISNGEIVVEIVQFLNEKYDNRFKIELLMLPNWATKSKPYKIGNDYFTHIRVKSID